LVEALIAATVDLIEERGVEQLSVREAAKRAGVSPGAPFRHFRSKTTLLTAVAE
jgi:AcrR family transcriptional regulator